MSQKALFLESLHIQTMKTFSLILSISILACGSLTAWVNHSSIQSSSNSVTEIKIGNQIWMKENLNVATFRNGDSIPQVKTKDEWTEAEKKKQPAWCYYYNNDSIGRIHGKLYNWYAVIDPRGLAPEGWHIPNKAEWMELIAHLGGQRRAGGKMKSTNGWYKNGNGSNSSGFSALPSGVRDQTALITPNDGFGALGRTCNWWSRTYFQGMDIFTIAISWKGNKVIKNIESNPNEGLSVRCVKD